jgi:hypothetical protein
MSCFTKLVARHNNFHPDGVGNVMSRGEYFTLPAYTIIDDGKVEATAGEKVRMARPFVGVV